MFAGRADAARSTTLDDVGGGAVGTAGPGGVAGAPGSGPLGAEDIGNEDNPDTGEARGGCSPAAGGSGARASHGPNGADGAFGTATAAGVCGVLAAVDGSRLVGEAPFTLSAIPRGARPRATRGDKTPLTSVLSQAGAALSPGNIGAAGDTHVGTTGGITSTGTARSESLGPLKKVPPGVEERGLAPFRVSCTAPWSGAGVGGHAPHSSADQFCIEERAGCCHASRPRCP